MKKPNRISRKSRDIPPFIVMDILEKADALRDSGIDVVNMGVGEPDFDTPEPIKRAGIAAIRRGYTKYTHSLGLLELRQAIAENFSNEYNVEIDPARILVTSGSSNALFLALASLIDKGSEVIMSDPGYSCYPHFVSFLGGKPVMIKVDENDRFQLRPEKIRKKITKRTCAILINSPANPTGMTLDSSVMKTIAKLGPVVVSDEIYHGLVYEGEANSILEFTDQAFVINGFSKRYAMTGWRLGYMIAPEKYMRPVQKMQQNFNISANSFVQWAGIAALRKGGPFLKKIHKTFDKRRKFLVAGLENIGLPVTTAPRGAYYVFTNASKYGEDSLKLAHQILDEAHVAVTPGIDFGEGGEGYLRFSYANSIENMEKGLTSLERLLRKM